MNETATPPVLPPQHPWSTRQWLARLRYAGVVAVLLVAIETPLAWIAPMEENAYGIVDPAGVQALFILVAVLGVFVAPFVETAIMGFVLLWLQKLPIHRVAVVVLYALGSTLSYRLFTPEAWRFFPIFAVLAAVFLSRGRSPTTDGFLVASLTHAFFNLFTVALIVGEASIAPV